jgi:uncharacterized protein (DUF433 family)
MNLVIHSDPVPLREDEHGVIRVGNTRVVLDLVIQAFHQGATPETIVQMYSTLSLADTYAVIAYYLRHTAEVDEYLRRREEEAAELRRQIEATYDVHGIRERLLARLAAREAGHAPPAGR